MVAIVLLSMKHVLPLLQISAYVIFGAAHNKSRLSLKHQQKTYKRKWLLSILLVIMQ